MKKNSQQPTAAQPFFTGTAAVVGCLEVFFLVLKCWIIPNANGQYLIKITIIINILLQQAKDAQAESPIFSYCGAEKLRESENVHSDTICCIQEQVKHCDDLAPSTANRAQGESFKTISSTLTRFLQKCICLFPFPPVYLQGCLCLCLCISHLFARLCAVE